MKHRSPCPIARTLDLVGDKWTLLVIRDLAFGKRHFDQFLASREAIAPNILAARLRKLRSLGLVAAAPETADRRRVAYRLTEKGEALRELARLVAQWGLAHLPGSAAAGRL
jgi:DNA-binding HxlR family transcriptional regulator